VAMARLRIRPINRSYFLLLPAYQAISTISSFVSIIPVIVSKYQIPQIPKKGHCWTSRLGTVANCGGCCTSTSATVQSITSQAGSYGQFVFAGKRSWDDKACQAAVSLNQSRREGRGLVLHNNNLYSLA
jgi:hypothetical protein